MEQPLFYESRTEPNDEETLPVQPYTMAMAAKHKEEAYGGLRTPISREIDTHKNN